MAVSGVAFHGRSKPATREANPQVASSAESDRSATDLSEASRKAIRIYEERLKSCLEPELIGSVVAIHPESGDHAVGESSPLARHQLRQRHAEGAIVTMSIGWARRNPGLDRMLGAGVLKLPAR